MAIRKDIAFLAQKMEQHTLLLVAHPQQQPQQHILPKSKQQLVPDSRRIGNTRQRCIVQKCKQKHLPNHTITTMPVDEIRHMYQSQQDASRSSLQPLVFLNLVEHLDQSVELFEPLHETITMPLLFMRTAITVSFNNLVAKGLLLVSDTNAQYIMLIVDHLLAQSHEVSANALKRPSSHSGHYRASTPHTLGWKPATKLSSMCVPMDSNSKYNAFHADQEYTSQNPSGLFSARIHVWKGFTGPSQLLAFQLSFFPRDELCPVRLSITFASHRLVEAITRISFNLNPTIGDFISSLNARLYQLSRAL